MMPTELHSLRGTFSQHGYVAVPSLASPETIASINREIDSVCEGATVARHNHLQLEMEPGQSLSGTRVRRLYAPCRHYDECRTLSTSSRVLDLVEALLGPNLVLHYSKVNMKPPEIGSAVDWHQDMLYYPLTNPASLAVLLYLEDASEENGCLRVVPWSEHHMFLDHSKDGYFTGSITDPTFDPSGSLPLPGKAGTAIFLHCMTPHGSSTNRSASGRRTLIVSYRSADAAPIYFGPMTAAMESESRLVRGEMPATSRLEFRSTPNPRYRNKITSLYDLQAAARAS